MLFSSVIQKFRDKRILGRKGFISLGIIISLFILPAAAGFSGFSLQVAPLPKGVPERFFPEQGVPQQNIKQEIDTSKAVSEIPSDEPREKVCVKNLNGEIIIVECPSIEVQNPRTKTFEPVY